MEGDYIQQPRRQAQFNQTFQSSLVDYGAQKFAIDKSLVRGIKNNDVSKIVDAGEEGQIEDKVRLYDQKADVAQVAVSVRAKYDELKTETTRISNHIDKMKGNIQLLKADETKFKAIYDKQKKDLQSVSERLNEVTTSMQCTVYRRDIYLQIQQNTKKDIIVLKKRYFDMDVSLNRDRTRLKSLRTDAFNKQKLGQSCRKMLESVEKTVVYKQRERSSKINSFHQVLHKKHQNVRRKSEREKQIEDVMLAAMTEKSQEQKEWIKIFTVNNFLKLMLKTKMERIMVQHNQTEKAFQTIKLQTGVSHADDFIQRFLNRQKNYGRLLESISEKEAKLNNVKSEREHLDSEHQDLIYRADEIHQLYKKILVVPESDEKTIQRYNQELLMIERQRESMYQWAVKCLTGLMGLPRKDTIYKKYSRKQNSQNLKTAFVDSLNSVRQFLDSLDKQPEIDSKIKEAYHAESSGVKQRTMTEQTMGRNMRVMTETNELENGAVYEEMENQDMAYDDLSEMDYLHHYRKAIKKSDLQNRRFRIKTRPY